MRLIFATNNAHKLEEARAILPQFEIVSLAEIGLHADIPETADTLQGNSLQKTDYVYRWLLQNPQVLAADVVGCFADDTGLEIDALGGQPGVYTARFAGEECDPAANRAKTLRLLEGETNRKAQFRTVVSLYYWNDGVSSLEHPHQQLFEGIVKGCISTEERGDHGFGYDPIFIPEGYSDTFAVLPSELKNTISHRARAMAALAAFFEK